MKTEEDEAFDELARKQGAWGGGFKAKKAMATDKLQEDLLNYGTAWSQDGKRIDPMSVYKEQPAQEPSATRPCRSCNGTGDRDTGIAESPIATCKPCTGTGQIALAQPAQEPVCDKDPQGCWNVRCQLGKQCKNLAQPAQKPVAWMVYTQDGQSVYVTDNPTDIQEGQRALPLYTTPPQREWVGLNDEERNKLWRDVIGWGDPSHKEEDLMKAVEAKLRSKNT